MDKISTLSIYSIIHLSKLPENKRKNNMGIIYVATLLIINLLYGIKKTKSNTFKLCFHVCMRLNLINTTIYVLINSLFYFQCAREQPTPRSR